MSPVWVNNVLTSRAVKVQELSRTGTSIVATIDNHIIALMRLVLTVSALVVMLIDPVEPAHFVATTYLVLSLYTAYSAFLYLLALYVNPIPAIIIRWAHWVDVGWAVV